MSEIQQLVSHTVPTLSALEGIHHQNWTAHARERVETRAGLTYTYIDEVIFRPYGRIYRDRNRRRFILFDPDEDTPTDKPRAVVVAVDGRTATVVTAYNVDNPAMYDDGAQFLLRGVRMG